LISTDAGSDAKTVYTNKALGTGFDHPGAFLLLLISAFPDFAEIKNSCSHKLNNSKL